LPRPRLARDPHDLPAPDRERDPVHRAHRLVLEVEVSVEVVDLEQGVGHGRAHLRSFGSSASRRPSPTMLKDMATRISMTPGTAETWGATERKLRPSEHMMPQSGRGGVMPSPRKDSPAPSTIKMPTRVLP